MPTPYILSNLNLSLDKEISWTKLKLNQFPPPLGIACEPAAGHEGSRQGSHRDSTPLPYPELDPGGVPEHAVGWV